MQDLLCKVICVCYVIHLLYLNHGILTLIAVLSSPLWKTIKMYILFVRYYMSLHFGTDFARTGPVLKQKHKNEAYLLKLIIDTLSKRLRSFCSRWERIILRISP